MQFSVERMACGGCVKTVTDAILAIDTDARVDADTVAKTVKVETSASSDEIVRALTAAGYPATPN